MASAHKAMSESHESFAPTLSIARMTDLGGLEEEAPARVEAAPNRLLNRNCRGQISEVGFDFLTTLYNSRLSSCVSHGQGCSAQPS